MRLLFLLLLTGSIACQSAAAELPPRTAAPTGDERADQRPVGWNDPRILTELAKNCAFDPETLSTEARAGMLGKSRSIRNRPAESSGLSCEPPVEQSCGQDECKDRAEESCKPRCISRCKGCSKDCVAGCEKCKQGCHDDACRMKCAATCGACHERCVRQLDHCATGTCHEEWRQCRLRIRNAWRSKGCPAVCSQMEKCQQACINKTPSDQQQAACDKPCRPKNTKGCNLDDCPGPFAGELRAFPDDPID